MSVDLMRLCWRVEFPSPAMSAVAVKLADCANDEGENVYPSVGRIERETRLGASTVRRVLAAFEEAGLLEVVAEAHGNKWLRSTVIRRFNVGLLHSLSAVEVRRGKVIDYHRSTHVLKEVLAGNATIWVVAERTADDPSDYAPNPDAAPPTAGGVDPGHPSHSGRVPLPQREGTPPTAGANPSKEPPTKEPPNPRAAGEQAGLNSGWQSRQAEAVRQLEHEGRHPAAVRHLVAPILAARRVRGLNPGDLAAIARDANALAQPLLAKAAELVIADRRTETVTAEQITAAVAAVRKGGLMIAIKPTTHAAQWAAWVRHFEDTEPRLAAVMRRQSGWQVPTEWPSQQETAA